MRVYIIDPKFGRTEINDIKLTPKMLRDGTLYSQVISNNMGVGVRITIDLEEIDKLKDKKEK